MEPRNNNVRPLPQWRHPSRRRGGSFSTSGAGQNGRNADLVTETSCVWARIGGRSINQHSSDGDAGFWARLWLGERRQTSPWIRIERGMTRREPISENAYFILHNHGLNCTRRYKD